MMNKKCKLLAAAMGCIVSGMALATSPQTGDLTVKMVEVDTRFVPAQALVYTNEALPNPGDCRLAHRYVFSISDDGAKGMLSMLLAAKSSGQIIRFNTDGCQDSVPKIVITTIK